MRILFRVLLAVSSGLAANLAVAASLTAVEYFHSGFGHYFVTAAPQEIAALDADGSSGWSRTGDSFDVLELDSPGAARVCRFWSGPTYAPRSSHFHTSFDAECAQAKGDPKWRFEGEVFAMNLPGQSGTCPAGTVTLYRLYNNGQNGAPNHRYTTRPTIRTAMLAQGWTAEGAGVGVVGCLPPSTEQVSVKGRVLDGRIAGALVCLDANRNGRCDGSETQATTDATGSYELVIAKDSLAPLVAEVIAGRSRDIDTPAATVDLSYRMASPSRDYGTDITPYSTLVHLAGPSDYGLAEDMVRALTGLPPKFDMRPAAGSPSSSLRHSVATWIVKALKANGLTLDLSAPDALATVVASFSTALAELPQLRITTRNSVPIDSKEVYVDATYVLTNPAAATPVAQVNGRIRGRGNSTWGQPKNPYKVQFNNDASYAAIADVLGMKKQRNWALLADYFDRSLIRNKLALSLGSSSVFTDGLKWTPSGQHVEVWLNNDYVGVYLLTEDIRIDPARLDLKRMGANDVDGAYIVEVDERLDCYKGEDLDLQLVTAHGVPFCVDTPDEEAITPNQLAWIKNLLVGIEGDLYQSNRLDGINATSFVDWYLIQELFRNNDAIFLSSTFMWKDTATATRPQDRLLNMGPLWDFDRSAGNINYNDNWEIEGCWVSKGYQPNWMSRLFDHPDFLALTISRWKQKRPSLGTLVNASIDTYARRLAVAQQRNFQRWPIFGLWLTNYYMFQSHDEEVAFVRRFLNDRMAWLDRAYASPEAFNALCK